jgi:hypothetical protein
MIGSSRVRTVTLLLLVAALLLPSLALADKPDAKERPSPRLTLATLWNALPGAWVLFKAIWEREGSSLDPFGSPKPNEGSSLDPFGGK